MKPISALLLQKFVGLFSISAAILIFFFLVWSPWNLARKAKQWKETPCLILSSKMEVTSGPADGPESYHPKIRYSYQISGRSFESDRYYLGVFGGSEAKAKKIVEKYPEGSRSTAFVNPNDPTQATLNRSVALSWLPLILGFGFFVFGAFLFSAKA